MLKDGSSVASRANVMILLLMVFRRRIARKSVIVFSQENRPHLPADLDGDEPPRGARRALPGREGEARDIEVR